MKKKIIPIILLLIIIAVAIIFIKSKTSKKATEYEISEINMYQYLKYKEKESFGVIDREGNIIIEANYNDIKIPNPEKDIFICYTDKEANIVLNSKKEELFTTYEQVEPIKIKNIANTLCYEKSVLQYKKDGKYGLIDFNGKEITGAEYEKIENLQSTEGKFLVYKSDKCGVINLKGTKLVDTKYDQIKTDEYYTEEKKYVESGFIVSNTTEEGYRYGYVDYQGRELLKPEFTDVGRITEQKEVYLIVAKNGQYGLYKGSKQLLKPEYQSMEYTENESIIIEKNAGFGIANLKGEIKIEPKYKQIEEDGIYLYAQNEQENSVYDSNGNKIDISFNKSIYKTENEEYRITTVLNNEIKYYGIENKNGNALVDTEYSYIEHLYGEYFIAENSKEKYGIIDANGKAIIKFQNDLIQKIIGKDLVQVSSRKTKETKIYSSTLEEIASIKNAKIDNNETYIKIYNDKEKIYIDKQGNKFGEDSEIIQKEQQRELPNEISGYKTVRISLEDVYYEK